MRKLFLAFAFLLSTHASQAQLVIGPEFQMLAQAGLHGITPVHADDERRKVLEEDFAEMLHHVDEPCRTRVELVVVFEGITATASRNLLALGRDWARQDKAARLFTMAHELGHVCQGHRSKVDDFLIERHLKPVDSAEAFQSRYTAMRHGIEFEADDFATRVVRAMGASPVEGISYIRKLYGPATQEHPASAQRIARVAESLK